MEQGSPEWHDIRRGKVTASRVADVVARIKSGYGASRANYMSELVIERLTGETADRFVSKEMQWGIDHEAEARAAYEFRQEVELVRIAFVDHPTIGMAGASPDSYVGDKGMVEIKCPNSATHIDTLLAGTIKGRYFTQTQWQMACCPGREWCDFVSWDPRLPENMKYFSERIMRDESVIHNLEGEVISFLQELDETVAQLRDKYDRQ